MYDLRDFHYPEHLERQQERLAAQMLRSEQDARWAEPETPAATPVTVERVLEMNRAIANRLPGITRPTTCPRCGRRNVARVCDFCGRDRADTLATTEVAS